MSLDTARDYVNRGWAVVPIPQGKKGPTLPDWQKLRATEADLPRLFGGGPRNVGVILGDASNGLVDVDLDTPEAEALADDFLPITLAEFGRPSKPRSHRLYISPGVLSTVRYRGPDGATLVELRSTGGQTVMPGSVHPSGEAITWAKDGPPEPVDADKLQGAVARLAAASLLVRNWPGLGSRHDAHLALVGGLMLGGWTADGAEWFAQIVAEAAGSDISKYGRTNVKTTERKLAQEGAKTTGWPTLAGIVGDDVVTRVREWLGMADKKREDAQAGPTAVEAEEAILSAALRSPEAVQDALTILEPHDFADPDLRAIALAIWSLAGRGEAVDVVTVGGAMATDTELVAKLAGLDINPAHAASYARMVLDASKRRQTLTASARIAELVAHAETADAAVMAAQGLLAGISASAAPTHAHGAVDTLVGVLERMGTAQDAESRRANVRVGFRDLDTLTGGFHRGDLIVLAARPAMGKTACSMSMAANAALNYGARVAVFSLEMSRDQLWQRLLSVESGVDMTHIRHGLVSQDDVPRITAASARLYMADIVVDDTSGLTIQELTRRARAMHAQKPLDLIVVDYLQLMAGGGRRSDNRQNEVSDISRGLKVLARELSVPVLALSQLNRAVENRPEKIPQLADLRDSGAVEQDADIVMFVFRDEVYNPTTTERRGIAELHIAKHRNGGLGRIDLGWLERTTRFIDLDATKA